MNYLGIEIGGTKLQICLGDERAQIKRQFRFAVNRAEGGAGIRRQIEKTVREVAKEISVRAIGVGFGGPIDWQTGRVCLSHHIEGWSEFPLGEWLEEIAGAPVVADNDANVAALGEAVYGAAVDLNPSFYVTLGSGVGGGLVVDGEIYHGAVPGESEIGHVRLDKSGVIVESRCSGWAVDARVREAILQNPNGALARCARMFPGAEAKGLLPALENDSSAREILTETADDLALGLSHVVQLMHPAVIVLGGGLSLIGEPFRAAVERQLRRYIMKAYLPGPKATLAKLGENVVPVGALALAVARTSNHHQR